MQQAILEECSTVGVSADTHIVQLVFTLDAPLRADAWRAAWATMVARHPDLCARFVRGSDGAFRRELVGPRAIDIAVIESEAHEGGLAEILERDRVRAIDLDSPPLLRSTVVQASDSAVISITYPHALLDGWSALDLLQEVFDWYGGNDRRLARPAYDEYVTWLEEESSEVGSGFWSNQATLSHHEPLWGRTPRGQLIVEERSLDPEESRTIEALGRELSVPPSSLFYSAVALATARRRYDGSAVVGVAAAIRPLRTMTRPYVLGPTVAVLPVRLMPEDDLRVDDWLVANARNLQGSAAYGRSLVKRGLEQLSGTWDIVFFYQQFPMPSEQVLPTGERLRFLDYVEMPPYPASIAVIPGTQFRLRLSYYANAVRGGEARGVLRSITEAFRCFSKHASRVADLDVRTSFDLQLQERVTRPRRSFLPAARHPDEVFRDWARRQPAAVAVTDVSGALTYAELDAAASAVAATIPRHQKEKRVALLVSRSRDAVIAQLAAIRAGLAYVPLDQGVPIARNRAIVDQAGASVALVSPELEGLLGCDEVCVPEAARATGAHPSGEPASATEPMYVLFTSGSTGALKGVEVGCEQVWRLFAAAREHFELRRDDVWSCVHPLTSDFSVWEIWGALLHGASVRIFASNEVLDARTLCRGLCESSATVLSATPTLFRHIDRAEAADRLEQLRYVVLGRETLDPQMLSDWFHRHGDSQPRVANMYGMTETTVHATLRWMGAADADDRRSVIGRPLADLGVLILDRRLREMPVEAVGEICVIGSGVARGYLNRAEDTDGRFAVRDLGGRALPLYRSGDLGRLSEEGEVEYERRRDRQLKVRGTPSRAMRSRRHSGRSQACTMPSSICE